MTGVHYKLALNVHVFDLIDLILLHIRVRVPISNVAKDAHGATGRQIDPSLWTHLTISRSSQCSTSGVILSVG